MSKQRDDGFLQSLQLNTILLVNNQLVGNPGQDDLTKICGPPLEEKDTLIFQTSYLVPQHNFSYVYITISHWAADKINKNPSVNEVGTVVLPMSRSQEPKLQTLSEAEAARLLGVDACSHKAAKYTIFGTPRLHTSKYMANISRRPIKEELKRIARIINSNSTLKIELIHPIYGTTKDLSLDLTVRILKKFTEGWHRDANNPLAIYFAKSPSLRMIDLDTVPKGEDIPYMDQLPALAVFDSKEQYYVAMAVGNQQEKEYHDRQHGKLCEFDVPARFIRDRRSLHPESNAPQEYFMLINASSAGADTDHLLPRIGDSAEIVLKGVSTKQQEVSLYGHRINAPSELWPAQTRIWKLRVPLDKTTGSAKLPLVLNLPDASADDAENPFKTIGAFTEQFNMNEAYVNVRMKIIDSDKTHEAEMNALKKLMAPHTMPMDDRPSLTSINAVEDLITANLRDGKLLKEFMTDLEKLRQGTHENEELQNGFKRLDKDKTDAIKYLLDDQKLIKYIHGPPGTGKSYLALWIVCIALMFDPPTTGTDDEWDRPLDLGPQIEPKDYDNVDLSAPLRSMQLTDEQKAALSSAPPRTKILIVSGQNTAVDDLLPRLMPLWTDLGGPMVRKQKPVVLRLYSWESECRCFVRRFAQVGRHIQRTTEDTTGGILMRLLDAFSDRADEFDREGRKARSSNTSIVDKAVELYKADRKASQGRKYDELTHLINQVASSPDQIYTISKQITRLVENGPQTEALAQADVIFGTLIGVADPAFRQMFRPHYIISDESPRDKEITFLILLAHFSPRAYFCFGDHKQLCPVIFSKHQHRKYKSPMSFKEAGIDAQKNQEEGLPNPSTFANQMETSVIHRLVEAGHPSYMLTQNWRQHGAIGEFFNKQFYNRKIRFHEVHNRFSLTDKAAVRWLQQLSGKDQIKGTTLMINMNSSESCEARSFLNHGNVNFVLVKVIDLLADPDFSPSIGERIDGKVMIIVPYDAQRNLYTYELQKRGNLEMDSKGNWVQFDKSRVEIRTHQGAQGHEASVAIIDLTRSDKPGMTGQSQLISVCSSRSICAQLVLINTSMLERPGSKNSPAVENLVAWVKFHQAQGMLIDMDTETAKKYRIACTKCYGVGHKGSECPYSTGKRLICPNCGSEHHPRDCYMAKSNNV